MIIGRLGYLCGLLSSFDKSHEGLKFWRLYIESRTLELKESKKKLTIFEIGMLELDEILGIELRKFEGYLGQ